MALRFLGRPVIGIAIYRCTEGSILFFLTTSTPHRPKIDCNMTALTVPRPEAALATPTVAQDVLRRFANGLTGQRHGACFIGGVLQEAGGDAELGLVGVDDIVDDLFNRFLAVGEVGGVEGAFATTEGVSEGRSCREWDKEFVKGLGRYLSSYAAMPGMTDAVASR